MCKLLFSFLLLSSTTAGSFCIVLPPEWQDISITMVAPLWTCLITTCSFVPFKHDWCHIISLVHLFSSAIVNVSLATTLYMLITCLYRNANELCFKSHITSASVRPYCSEHKTNSAFDTTSKLQLSPPKGSTKTTPSPRRPHSTLLNGTFVTDKF